MVNEVLRRLASQVATMVQGKDKPTYTSNHKGVDMCIVLNAKDICVTGRKLTDKICVLIMDFIHLPYMYVGHLKERSLKDQLAKDPTEVIHKAVLRMLPRNKLRDVSTTKTSFSLSQYEELKIKLNPFEFGIILFKEY
ncbi:hypothetical protein HYC85_002893 [Camellia sinensis]|uniref:Ribosomal protein L13 n=1 Tax=Camellia sinensis TaxID=4442 RepID=A0A7J7IB83_CAMSI|nr:hypothetical protein HYC85_002893 [Camellia sinensis]